MTRFRELRLQRGLSQEQLCREYNEKYNRKYTTAAMSLIEHGKRSPELGALLDFADFYGVSLDYLLGRDLAGQTAYEFSVDSRARSWQLSEQLRNIILGLYSMKGDIARYRENIAALNGSGLGSEELGVDDKKAGSGAADDGELSADKSINQGQRVVLDELKRLDDMSEDEENLEMLRSLLKQSIVLARRVEKKRRAWYKY